MDASDHYRILRSIGHPKRAARHQALVDAVRSADAEQLDSGLVYDGQQARQAAVHTREDLVLAISHLGEIGSTLRSIRRWTIVAVVLLAVLWFSVVGG